MLCWLGIFNYFPFKLFFYNLVNLYEIAQLSSSFTFTMLRAVIYIRLKSLFWKSLQEDPLKQTQLNSNSTENNATQLPSPSQLPTYY